jgi:hypothetical protein
VPLRITQCFPAHNRVKRRSSAQPTTHSTAEWGQCSTAGANACVGFINHAHTRSTGRLVCHVNHLLVIPAIHSCSSPTSENAAALGMLAVTVGPMPDCQPLQPAMTPLLSGKYHERVDCDNVVTPCVTCATACFKSWTRVDTPASSGLACS